MYPTNCIIFRLYQTVCIFLIQTLHRSVRIWCLFYVFGMRVFQGFFGKLMFRIINIYWDWKYHLPGRTSMMKNRLTRPRILLVNTSRRCGYFEACWLGMLPCYLILMYLHSTCQCNHFKSYLEKGSLSILVRILESNAWKLFLPFPWSIRSHIPSISSKWNPLNHSGTKLHAVVFVFDIAKD